MVNPSASSSQPEDARWITYSRKTRAVLIGKDTPAFRPLREADILVAGEDFLHRHFYAGTPCSKTHLIWFVAKGGMTIDFGDGPKPMARGQVAISPAIHPHWVRLATPKAKGVWFHLHNTPRWEHLYGAGPRIRPARLLADLEWLMDHCLAELAISEAGALQNTLHYAGALAVVLERELASSGVPSKSDPRGKKLACLWNDVAIALESKWTVNRMSQALCISESHLHRLCLRRYGTGPMGVVTRMRIDRAMHLLLSSRRKLDDIAAELGYASAYAFSDAFQRHVGQRPNTFRTQQLDM
jgi:AraC-like DNA-binding protein/mannose-6-phosphate isomerase-like protein (cupin superfamily)